MVGSMKRNAAKTDSGKVRKKDRFEVFKRDKFTCQYCGRKAPDVVLELDHIEPRAKGGKNTLLNYLTSCSECNRGKGDRVLSDDTVLTKQRQQLDQLAERREQIRMMAAWQADLIKIDAEAVKSLAGLWKDVSGYSLTASGTDKLRQIYQRFGFDEAAEAIRIAADTYFESEAGGYGRASVEHGFDKLGGICHVRKAESKDPDAGKVYYIRGILRKRLSRFNESGFWAVISAARKGGLTWDDIQSCAREAHSWTDFQERIWA